MEATKNLFRNLLWLVIGLVLFVIVAAFFPLWCLLLILGAMTTDDPLQFLADFGRDDKTEERYKHTEAFGMVGILMFFSFFFSIPWLMYFGS